MDPTITGGRLRLPNGFTISVQWKEMNYCDERTAEVAVWDDMKRWVRFGEGEWADTVRGYTNTRELFLIITQVMSFGVGANANALRIAI